jgi:hypothetical protein
VRNPPFVTGKEKINSSIEFPTFLDYGVAKEITHQAFMSFTIFGQIHLSTFNDHVLFNIQYRFVKLIAFQNQTVNT